MPWPLPMDGQFATYAYAPPLVLALVAAIAALHVFEAVTRRFNVLPRRSLIVGAVVVVAVAGGLALQRTLATGTPVGDHRLAQAFGELGGMAHASAVALGWALSFPFAIAALFGLF